MERGYYFQVLFQIVVIWHMIYGFCSDGILESTSCTSSADCSELAPNRYFLMLMIYFYRSHLSETGLQGNRLFYGGYIDLVSGSRPMLIC